MHIFWAKTRNFIWRFGLALFLALAVFTALNGIFFWSGLDPNYESKHAILRGVQMLFCLAALGGVWIFFIRSVQRIGEHALTVLSAVGFFTLFVLQMVYLLHEPCQLRYDALKVFDEALSMLSDGAISKQVFDGYFARYTNNHGITIFAYLILKIASVLHILAQDYHNALLILQIVNLIFTDLAFLFGWLFLKSAYGKRAAFLSLLFLICCPLSYVWLPFFYTNSISMVFCMGTIYLLYETVMKNNQNPVFPLGSGIFIAAGFVIRATQVIVCIAILVWLMIAQKKKYKHLFISLVMILFGICLTLGGYQILQQKYTIKNTDAQFPATHWIAMGLNTNSGGGFDTLDEAYTMSFATARQKKEADIRLIKERLHALGPIGVCRLYFDKLKLTFSDGTGGYPTELSISEKYDGWYQNVYGNRRFYLQYYCQLTYLLALCFCIYGAALLLLKKEYFGAPAYCIYLTLLGAFLFHMLWEAGNIYSIGFICLFYAGFGCAAHHMTAYAATWLIARGNKTAANGDEQNHGILQSKTAHSWILQNRSAQNKITQNNMTNNSDRFRKCVYPVCCVLLCLCCVVWVFYDYMHFEEERRVALSVNQYLFSSDSYEPCEDEMRLIQTFQTEDPFDEIYLQAINDSGSNNDSIYRISLLDADGSVIETCHLTASEIASYSLIPLSLHSKSGNTEYALAIEKLEGDGSLAFLYYDTGNVDAYKDGSLTGLKNGKKPDLCFIVLKVL